MRRWILTGALTTAAACRTAHTLDLGPAPAGVTVDAQVQYYDITANSLAELRRAMVTEGPRGSEGGRWAAVTSWRLQWTYRQGHRGVGCVAEHARVRVTTMITFPRWNPSSQPDSALTEWWYLYNAGLAEHERGHAQIAVKAGGQIVKELNDMTVGTCDDLPMRADERGRQISRAAQILQAEYDAVTGHGRTQILKATRLQAP